MTSERQKEIASTIIQQLGGFRKLTMMTGAYNFVALESGVTFRVKNQKANVVKVVLTSMDLYDVEIGRIKGDSYKVVYEKFGLYNDQLKAAIEEGTGLYLSLFKNGGQVKSEDNNEKKIKNYFKKLKDCLKREDCETFDQISDKIHDISDLEGLTNEEYETWDSLREKCELIRLRNWERNHATYDKGGNIENNKFTYEIGGL